MSTHNICFEALLMSTHNICFRGEIRKNTNTFGLKNSALTSAMISVMFFVNLSVNILQPPQC